MSKEMYDKNIKINSNHNTNSASSRRNLKQRSKKTIENDDNVNVDNIIIQQMK